MLSPADFCLTPIREAMGSPCESILKAENLFLRTRLAETLEALRKVREVATVAMTGDVLTDITP